VLRVCSCLAFHIYLAFLDLVVVFHADEKMAAPLPIVLIFVLLLSFFIFLWYFKDMWLPAMLLRLGKVFGAPAHEHSEPQSERSHPENHQDGLGSTTPEAVQLTFPPMIPPQTPDDTIAGPVKPEERHLPASKPVGDAEAEHPVVADADMYTYSPGLPAALVSASVSTQSVSSAEIL
jgi:hypothetical protein